MIPHKTVTQSTCLPPEAYIRLWNSAAKTATPKFKSTVYPSTVYPFKTVLAKSARWFNDDNFNDDNKFRGPR